MTLKEHFRHWLNLDIIERHNQAQRDILMQISDNLYSYHDAVDLNSRLLARILAKMDPLLTVSELDPRTLGITSGLDVEAYDKRKAESDRLSEIIIARMIAEHNAQRRY